VPHAVGQEAAVLDQLYVTHEPRLQLPTLEVLPTQSAPPWARPSQVRVLVCVPGPHDLEQAVQVDQVDQVPSIGHKLVAAQLVVVLGLLELHDASLTVVVTAGTVAVFWGLKHQGRFCP